jgi:hypothetical protein
MSSAIFDPVSDKYRSNLPGDAEEKPPESSSG